MSFHPLGEIVEIVGINSNTNGRSCEEHHTCGCVLEEDSLVQLRKHQVYINGHEQSAVGVYWVSDGVDQCLVGYLHRHQVKHLNKLEGALCQDTEVYSDNSDSPTKWHKHKKNFGCAIAAIVSNMNAIHVDVYWKKTVSFDYESIKFTSMDMNKVRLEYIGCQMAWINAL